MAHRHTGAGRCRQMPVRRLSVRDTIRESSRQDVAGESRQYRCLHLRPLSSPTENASPSAQPRRRCTGAWRATSSGKRCTQNPVSVGKTFSLLVSLSRVKAKSERHSSYHHTPIAIGQPPPIPLTGRSKGKSTRPVFRPAGRARRRLRKPHDLNNQPSICGREF